MDRNVGVDLSFFKGRINFTADYYNNRTDDVLEYLTVPLSTGRRNVKSNGGVVTNKGLELFLNIRWIQTSDITFSTSANVARNKNIIKRSIPAGMERLSRTDCPPALPFFYMRH